MLFERHVRQSQLMYLQVVCTTEFEQALWEL